MKKLSVAFSIAALAGAANQVSAADNAADNAATQQRPNIVVIMSDDQGPYDATNRGNPFFETPYIDALVESGMTFENAYSCGPNCAPSRACFISGMYQPRHKIYTPGGRSKGGVHNTPLLVPVQARFARLMAEQDGVEITDESIELAKNSFEVRTDLESDVVSIAQVLKQAGYTTARYGKWHVGEDLQGFDISSGTGEVGDFRLLYNDPSSAEKLTEPSLEFIREQAKAETPFFLFLSHYEVHTPIVAHPHVVEKYERKLKKMGLTRDDYNPTFAAMVEAFDNSVGEVVAELDKQGLTDNTIVIYTSDNGGLEPYSNNAPLRAGKGALYEGGIKVPLAIKWPGMIEEGSTTYTPMNGVDFLPTFAGLANVPLPDQEVDGIDLTGLLTGKADDSLYERPLFWHYPLYLDGEGFNNYVPNPGGEPGVGQGWRAQPASAIRVGDWKLIEYFGVDGNNRLELFNLIDDIGETTNLAGTHPDKARELQKQLQQWRKDTNAVEPTTANPFYINARR